MSAVEPEPDGYRMRYVAGVPVDCVKGDGPRIEEPGPGWYRSAVADCVEWVRDDNRVVINDRMGGGWRAYVLAERHHLWDLIAKGEAADDGVRLYAPCGEPNESLWAVVLLSGALFDVLPVTLPKPEGA